MLRRFLADREV